MNFKEILELIDKVADRGIAGVEIEQAGTKIRIDGKSAQPQLIHAYGTSPMQHSSEQPPSPMMMAAAPAHAAAAPPAPTGPPPTAAATDDAAGVYILKSPIVGTFYRAANPESPAFVDVGTRVKKGQVLCIVEAMKLMNEIESDVDGVITSIYPQNAQAIEYGEPLFGIKTS